MKRMIMTCLLMLTMVTMAMAAPLKMVGLELKQSFGNRPKPTEYLYVDATPELGTGLFLMQSVGDRYQQIYGGPTFKCYDFIELCLGAGLEHDGQVINDRFAVMVFTNAPVAGRRLSCNYYQERSTAIWQRADATIDLSGRIRLGLTAQSSAGIGPRLVVDLPKKMTAWTTTMLRGGHITNITSLTVTL